jgi:hypothetical protein
MPTISRFHFDLAPTFNNVEEERGDEFSLGIKQNQMLIVYHGAYGFKGLHFHSQRLETNNKDFLLFRGFNCRVRLEHSSRYAFVQRRDNPTSGVAFNLSILEQVRFAEPGLLQPIFGPRVCDPRLPLFAIAEFRLYRPFELVNRTTSVNSTRSEFLVEMLCVTVIGS